ncbi:MAG: hypothetical protein IT463_01965 [Planctomycetes bacterium]|nr:hypothetical protein [Planctomycetota bacterium]
MLVDVQGAQGQPATAMGVSNKGEALPCTPVGAGLFSAPWPVQQVARVWAYTPGMRSRAAVPAPGQERLTLQLEAEARVVVAVEEGEGKPVAGATVSLEFADAGESADWLALMELRGTDPIRTLTTDDAGEVRLPGLLAGMQAGFHCQTETGVAGESFRPLKASERIVLKIAQGGRFLNVKCQDARGNAIPAVALQYTAQRPAPKGWTMSRLVSREGVAVADASGVARVAFLHPEEVIEINDVSAGWNRIHSRDIIRPESVDPVVVLGRLRKLVVRVTYEGGEPYKGLITADAFHMTTVRAVSAGLSRYTSHEADWMADKYSGGSATYEHTFVELAADGSFPVDAYPDGADLTVSGEELRVGFKRPGKVIPGSEIPESGLVEIVVAKLEKGQGLGTFEFELGESPEGLVAQIVNHATQYAHELIDLSKTKSSSRLWAGTYEIRIFGRRSWQSPLIVHPGRNETVAVRPDLGPSCQARVTAITPEGAPIEGAVLLPLTLVHPVYPEDPNAGKMGMLERAISFYQAMSGSDGVMVLDGQPPGRRQYRVESAGTQFEVVDLDLRPDTLADGGTVVLYPAIGQLRVVVEGAPPQASAIKVDIAPSAGRDHRKLRALDLREGVCVFTGLAVERFYTIVIMHDKGSVSGQLIINQVELTRIRNVVEIRVKMSDLKYN